MKTAYILDWQDFEYGTGVYNEIRQYAQDREMGQNNYSEWQREEDDEEYPKIAEIVDLMCPDINLPVYIHIWW